SLLFIPLISPVTIWECPTDRLGRASPIRWTSWHVLKSGEDDGLVADLEDAVLGPGAHGSGEHEALGVLTELDELLGGVGVAHPCHLLLDDRALVEVGGHEVRRGADELDAAGVCLVVRPSALEAGQERVVDVDRPTLE